MSTFILVPGGGHNAWCWERMRAPLERYGHSVLTVSVPTSDPRARLRDYAAAVASAASSAGPDAVLVGHSAGGRYLPLAANLARVKRLVFLCALVPVEGESGELPGTTRPLDKLGCFSVGARRAARAFYQDCDPETRRWAIARLTPQNVWLLREAFPIGGWPKCVRSAYILGEYDRTIEPDRATAMAALLKVCPVRIPSGHSPFLSCPDLLARTLDELMVDESHWSDPSCSQPSRNS